MNEPVFTEYEGKPVIVLNPDTDYPFRFGLYKAKKAVEHYHSIIAHFHTYLNKAALQNAKKNNVKPKLYSISLGDYGEWELGYYKCLGIIENIEAIKSFVNKYA
jgi:hypothetical protein